MAKSDIEPGVADNMYGVERSIAISAKRQADALERIATSLEKLAPGGVLDPHFFAEAALIAGQHFERGRR